MDDGGAELQRARSILKHPSVSRVVTERQREGPPPPDTYVSIWKTHLSLSPSMTGDLLVSEPPWWMVTFPLFYRSTKSCAYLLWWPIWSCYLYLAGLEGLGDFFMRGSATPDHRRNLIFAVFFCQISYLSWTTLTVPCLPLGSVYCLTFIP